MEALDKCTAEWDVYVDDTPGISIGQLRLKARRLKMEGKLDIVYVDYLQLMRADIRTYSREQEVAFVSRELKSLAKELEVPVVAAAQLSRAGEHRSDKRPILADLRESGALEQDADVVMFLYREENGLEGETSPTDLIIAKQRNGPVGVIPLLFFKSTMRYECMSRQDLRLPTAANSQQEKQWAMPDQIPF